jgi:MYXO-CTERM domain-containing protein
LYLICRDQIEKRIEDFIMKKRFMLTAAGAAATGIAGTASAVVVDFNHGLDRWAGEHSWQLYTSGSSVAVASMYISSSQLMYAGCSSLSFISGTASSHFGNVTGVMDLASGTYNVQMQDAYGDGWAWNSYQGGLTIGSASGTVSASSASFSFTVAGVPAPGALALLGLAGVAGSRRRK